MASALSVLPIIGFGQEGAYARHGWYQWLSYALIISGCRCARGVRELEPKIGSQMARKMAPETSQGPDPLSRIRPLTWCSFSRGGGI